MAAFKTKYNSFKYLYKNLPKRNSSGVWMKTNLFRKLTFLISPNTHESQVKEWLFQ